MAFDKDAFISALDAMTVLELNDLVKAIEEKFGVSAAAMAAPGGGGGGAAAAAVVEEQTEFTLMLTEIGVRSNSDSMDLLDFGFGASVQQLLERCFGVGLRNCFLHRLRGAIDQVFGFLQAQARQLAHGLDDLHLVGAGFEQHDIEFGLLFGHHGSGTTSTSGRGGHGGGGNAELFFNGLDQVIELHHGHAVHRGQESVFIECHLGLPAND